MPSSYSRTWRNRYQPEVQDRIRCSVCGFRGIPIDFQPSFTTDANFITSTSSGGLRVNSFGLPGQCPFCGTNDPWYGRRGDL